MSSNDIKAINKQAVHRICSGQVVLNLAIAVKELVENSLDAGASVVEVTLREYGSELIQVSDNGSGVEACNFQGLTLKHHTSKLQDFSDLVSVETYGFRGEALSSLCSLSDLTVTTRHHMSDCGTRLVFDHNGHITSSSPVARQVGTTVTLENIFNTLPVRQKEFHRNLKREFAKMTQLLYAYCIVSTGVRIACTNHTKKGGRMTVASTKGCKTVRENIACMFGTKQLSSLLDLTTVPPSEETLEQLNIKVDPAQIATMMTLEGLVSSCAHGQGRSTNDRQFYFVNSRPCEPAKVMKVVNEVYHQYNMNQQPFIYLNIASARDSVDVNVTPDKRQVLLEHEKILVATIKSSLQALYENIPSTYTVNNLSSPKVNHNSCSMKIPSTSPAAILSQWRHSAVTKRPSSEQAAEKQSKQAKLDSLFSKIVSPQVPMNCVSASDNSKCQVVSSDDVANLNNGVSDEQTKSDITTSEHISNNSCVVESEMFSKESENTQVSLLSDPNRTTSSQFSESDLVLPSKCEESRQILQENDSNALGEEFPNSETLENPLNETLSKSKTEGKVTTDIFTLPTLKSDYNSVLDSPASNMRTGADVIFDSAKPNSVQTRRVMEVALNMDILKGKVHKSQESQDTAKQLRVKFRAVINPNKSAQAEQELSREISKDMFAKMEVVGQFNKGFIIARLDSDLFIVDQHATDEKYNFETLQRTTTLSSQKLVVPQPLELTAVNEAILMDNIKIFNANGFELAIDETAATTSKVKLTSIPMSRNWTFGKEDIDELLFMLQDAPNTLCRPSRVRAMFASRACRKSVMIGTALSPAEMKRLLTHMGEIDQPWNCPHGRPTMRHLINLDFL